MITPMAGVQSIERAFSILRVLARGTGGVTEIALRTDLPKSTVSRLLGALEAEGAVVQDGLGGDYAIGATLSTLSEAVSPRASLRGAIRPYIEELASVTGGSAGFTVRDGNEIYWVDDVHTGDELVMLVDQTGKSFPMHSVASGIALLARLDADDLDRYFRDLSAADASGVDGVDEAAIRRLVARVVAEGVMVSREELDPGVNAVAAAFRGPTGQWDGALYVQGPSFRFPRPGDELATIERVAGAAAELSERLST